MDPYHYTQSYMAERLRDAERMRLIAVARGRDATPSLLTRLGQSIKRTWARPQPATADALGAVVDCGDAVCCAA